MAERDEKGKFAKGNKPKGAALQSREEAAANGAKGGIASGEARRERRKWREMLEDLLELPIEITLPDKTKKSVTMNDAILFGQIKAATAGKTEAAKFLAQLKGELIEKQEIETKQDITVKDETAGMTDEQKQRLADLLDDIEHEKYMREHYGKDYETDTTE